MRQQYQLTKHNNGITCSSKEINSTPKQRRPATHTPPKRGKVTTFTPQHRRNLRKKWMDIDFAPYVHPKPFQPSGRGFFVTFVCPEENEYDAAQFCKLRSRVSQRTNQVFKDCYQGGIWRSELQENGTLHWHFVVFFQEEQQTEELWNFYREFWCKLTECHTLDYREHSVDCQTLYGELPLLKLRNYLSKKIPEDVEWIYGTPWGTFQDKRLPRKATEAHVLEDQETFGDTAIMNPSIMLEVLKSHPETRQLRKAQQLNLNWLGWSLDLPPDLTDEVWELYEQELAVYETMAS